MAGSGGERDGGNAQAGTGSRSGLLVRTLPDQPTRGGCRLRLLLRGAGGVRGLGSKYGGHTRSPLLLGLKNDRNCRRADPPRNASAESSASLSVADEA
jgi:hypothetical protein